MSGLKAKSIQRLLQAKFDEWTATIEDPGVREQVRGASIITGGAIASMLLGDKVNDFDVYFRDHATTKAVAAYYLARFQSAQQNGVVCSISLSDKDGRVKVVVRSAGVASEAGAEKPYEYFEARADGEAGGYIAQVMDDPGDIQETYEATEAAALATEDDGKPKYRPVFVSTNAITLSHRVQVILRFYGEPEDIHKTYDFVHCTNYWTSWDGQLVLNAPALEALLARELRYVGSHYPICSVIRLRKFLSAGWRINAGQILKMAWQISELNLKDPNVLEDQLTGVDAAYFMQLMTKLREKDPEKVNAAYLVEILDRMF